MNKIWELLGYREKDDLNTVDGQTQLVWNNNFYVTMTYIFITISIGFAVLWVKTW